MMFVILSFLLCMGSFVSCDRTLGIKCIEKERQALLSFKASLVDSNNSLHDWGSQEEKRDCCKWVGIDCNDTGHVIELDLSSFSDGLSGKISPSLPVLHQLEYLDLSGIDFQFNPIPTFLGSLTNLHHLNLSSANLSGRIPHQLANLSDLIHLDLHRNFLEGSVPFPLGDLASLTYLDLSENHLNGSLPNFSGCSSLSKLSLADNSFNGSIPDFIGCQSLRELDLSDNLLSGNLPNSVGQLSNLEHLDVSDNSLEGVISDTHFLNLTYLTYLDMSFNSFNGSIPDFIGCQSLQELDLSGNRLSGNLPNSVGQLSNLEHLDVSDNSLEGVISDTHFLNLTYLTYLNMSFNSFNGSIPDFTVCQSLQKLDLSSNRLTGNLTNGVGQLSNLEYLDVSSNSLEGVISDVHFLNLTHLTYLDMSFNSFSFELTRIPSQLEAIKLQSCKLGPSFPMWIQNQTVFTHLDISNASISDGIPAWFWNLPSGLKFLKLSSNELKGMLPNMTSKFDGYPGIDLSYNQLEGSIPILPSKLSSLNLAGNRFSGNLSFLCQIDEELTLLVLSNNLLSGRLPDCWLKFQKKLVVLNLSNNTLSGEIPSSLGFLSQLEALNLRSNAFVGELPMSLSNCTKLRFADIGENNLSGIIPTWIGERLSNLSFLVLRSNSFYGGLPSQLCWLNNLQVLDLSKNRFSGIIPRCVGNFTAMARRTLGVDITNHSYHSYYSTIDPFVRQCKPAFRCQLMVQHDSLKRPSSIVHEIIEEGIFNDSALVPWKGTKRHFERVGLQLLKIIDLSDNMLSGKLPYEITGLHGLVSLSLSMNKLHGEVPKHMGRLKSLDSLDLSRNEFSGNIPSSLSQITLSDLDLSYNNFSGRIPGPELQRFDCSSYIGNPHLYGPPLTPGGCGLPPATVVVGKEDEEEEEEDGGDLWNSYYIGMGTGFGVGFWGICSTIFFNRSCRHFLFASLTRIKDWIYVTVALHYLKLQRNFKRF